MKNMHIQYTKNNINRDMASFSRYETNGFEIFRLGSHTYPSRGQQKNLARLHTLTPDINSSHLIFYKAIMALDAHATYSSPSSHFRYLLNNLLRK